MTWRITAATYAYLVQQQVPGLTEGRLDWLATRADDDVELLDWLSRSDPVRTSIRAAYERAGRQLHEQTRTISGIAVPTIGLNSGWDRHPRQLVTTYSAAGTTIPDGTPVLWCHRGDDRRGVVIGSRLVSDGLRVWIDVERGVRGDNLLLDVATDQIGLSVSYAPDPETVRLTGTREHVRIGGLVDEVSVCPVAAAALGAETLAMRDRRPRNLPPVSSPLWPTNEVVRRAVGPKGRLMSAAMGRVGKVDGRPV